MKDPIKMLRGEFWFMSDFFEFQKLISFERMKYHCVLNAYLSATTTSPRIRMSIAEMHPKQALNFSKKIIKEKMSLNPRWEDEEYRKEILLDLVYQKFKHNPELGHKLLMTKERKIENGNYHHDNFLGICLCGDCPKEFLRPNGPEDVLGNILMEVRKRLQEEGN